MVGETVIAIGNAYGYEHTVTVGIVSAVERDVTLTDEQVVQALIQTDASINPGNSGGPLLNINGELIGVNVAIRAGAQGIGFAIPVDDVMRVAADMMSTRRLAAIWHGLVADEVRLPKLGRAVVLSDVAAGQPRRVRRVQAGRPGRPGRRPDRDDPARHRARPARRRPRPPDAGARSAAAARSRRWPSTSGPCPGADDLPTPASRSGASSA